jgi:lipoprotein-releasing system permease protein
VNPNGINVVLHQKPKKETSKLRNALQIAEAIRKDPRHIWCRSHAFVAVFYNYGPVELNGVIAELDIIEEDKLFIFDQNEIRPYRRSKQARME